MSLVIRLVRLMAGLLICGIAVGLMIQSGLGVPPWDVLHQGVSLLTPLTIGQVSIAVGFVVILMWIPLRQIPGVGTIANAIVIGSTIDVVIARVERPQELGWRVGYMVAGPILMGLGSALYIGAGLGPGPRDGLMTGIAERGPTIRLTRTVIEGSVLLGGWALGGTFGLGTMVFAVGIGPMVQLFMGLIPGVYLRREATAVPSG